MSFLDALYVLILVLPHISADAGDLFVKSYDIDSICDKTKILYQPILLNASSMNQLNMHKSVCGLRLQTLHGERIMVRLQSSKVASFDLFCNNYIQVFDGPDSSSTALAAKNSCRDFETNYLVSSSNQVFIRFYTNVYDDTSDDYYTLLLIPTYKGECLNNEYRCSSGYCIDGRFQCNNNYITCDANDCPKTFSTYTGVYVAVGVCLAVIIALVVWRKKKKAHPPRHTSPSQESSAADCDENSDTRMFATAFTNPEDTPVYNNPEDTPVYNNPEDTPVFTIPSEPPPPYSFTPAPYSVPPQVTNGLPPSYEECCGTNYAVGQPSVSSNKY